MVMLLAGLRGGCLACWSWVLLDMAEYGCCCHGANGLHALVAYCIGFHAAIVKLLFFSEVLVSILPMSKSMLPNGLHALDATAAAVHDTLDILHLQLLLALVVMGKMHQI
ncbi:hypothetical protein U1Q18_028656 [Sarracenia purpurea var. burkii]